MVVSGVFTSAGEKWKVVQLVHTLEVTDGDTESKGCSTLCLTDELGV